MKLFISFLFFILPLSSAPTFSSFFSTQIFSKAFGQSFSRTKIKIKNKIIVVELARTPEQQEKGLSYRKKINKDHGMLFIFSKEKTLSFWMKNTYIPLSIGFFDKNKTLVDIQKMTIFHEKQFGKTASKPISSHQSKKPALYALEVPMGFFKKHKINLGSRFRFLKNTD